MTLSGYDYLKAMTSGEVAPLPIAATLGFDTPAEVEPGKVDGVLRAVRVHYNPIGSAWRRYSRAARTASACAVHSMLPAGTAYTTLKLKINYIALCR